MPETLHPPLRVFIGFDPRQVISYTACAMSVVQHASVPVAITPLVIETLPITRQGLTPFTYSRFLVPWLCNFEGPALFCDADVLFTGDVAALVGAGTGGAAVLVRDDPDGIAFERAALMLFECEHPDNAVLTPDYIDDPERCRAPHTIDWTQAVGTFDTRWGHLVGYNAPRTDALAVHFTQGVPAWPETFACEWSEEWLRTVSVAMYPWAMRQVEAQMPWSALMAQSVHAKTLPDGRVVPKLYDPGSSPGPAPAVPRPEESGEAA